MYDRTASEIKCYMTAVADDIARLSLAVGYTVSTGSHRCRAVWQVYTKVCIYRFDKSGTIRTIGQGLTAPYIWVSNKLTSITGYRIASTGVAGTAGT